MYNHPSSLIHTPGHIAAGLQTLVLPPDTPRTAFTKRAEGKQVPVYSMNDLRLNRQAPVYSMYDLRLNRQAPVYSMNDLRLNRQAPVYSMNDLRLNRQAPVYSMNDLCLNRQAPVYSMHDLCLNKQAPVCLRPACGEPDGSQDGLPTRHASRIVVLGAGESGVGAAVLAGAKGFDVFVSDSGTIAEKYKAMLLDHGIPFEEGHHTEAQILNADEIVKSPGIPDTAPIVRAAVERGIPILSEIELAGRYTDAQMVCITGSNGKTTTTSLTYHILREAGMDVGLAGNIGRSLALQVAEEPHACYVIELSSFQLDNMYSFKADIAVLMNITPDHLNRYGGEMQRYVDAKLRILQNQTRADAFIYWADDPILRREVAKHHPEATCYPFSDADRPELKGRLTGDGQICIETPRGTLRIPRTALALRGTHNLYNSLAAATAARLAGADDASIRRGLETFRGVEHRLEPVARVADVEYINDSKATNIDSCRYALQSVETPIVLILGGTDKGNDYGEIEAMVRAKARGLVFLGVDNRKLHAAFDGKVPATCDARSMAEAIAAAARMAHPGDTVLLSPCCASFDLFRNYEDRGEQFKQCVHALADGKEARP